jgi:hypothetical protein
MGRDGDGTKAALDIYDKDALMTVRQPLQSSRAARILVL